MQFVHMYYKLQTKLGRTEEPERRGYVFAFVLSVEFCGIQDSLTWKTSLVL